ncbi:programmed cell death protein 5-like [Lytechinus variegatus]|uniref:programmed cell death protein 5-like n=1 Tax=Lytechinus variegatus TaxID=7654 RepID=UPI001BB19D38|nr:programmed cell death protein 5-like [Lytechinus variegatus]
MGDSELEAIRARRMAELQQQMGGQDVDQEKQRAEALQREQEMKNTMLAQLLDQSARARLNSIALVKPEKAKMVENMLINMARSGQVGGKINEEQLKGLLEQVSEKTGRSGKVKFDRRRLDSDDDDY